MTYWSLIDAWTRGGYCNQIWKIPLFYENIYAGPEAKIMRIHGSWGT